MDDRPTTCRRLMHPSASHSPAEFRGYMKSSALANILNIGQHAEAQTFHDNTFLDDHVDNDELPPSCSHKYIYKSVSPKAARMSELPMAMVASACVGIKEGLTSMRSMATSSPDSASASQMKCASRKLRPPRTGVPVDAATLGSV